MVIHSPEGLVHAIDSQNGKLRWSKTWFNNLDLRKDFLADVPLLILGDKVILNVGGKR